MTNIDEKSNRDKFVMLSGIRAPAPLPAWANANTIIGDKSRTARTQEQGLKGLGYYFPDPGMITGVESQWKVAEYIKQYHHIKNCWMLRMYTGNSGPCSPQDWRMILSLGILLSGNKGDDGKRTFNTMKRDEVRLLIGDCLKAAGMVEHALAVVLPEIELKNQTVHPRHVRRTTWELCELNFRWELRALDRRLVKRNDSNTLQREEMILRCFSLQYSSLSSVHPSLARSGIASPVFLDRLPYLRALWSVMNDWDLPKPLSWNDVPCGTTHDHDKQRWECQLAQFYAQTFYFNFDRPATLPYTLTVDDIENV